MNWRSIVEEYLLASAVDDMARITAEQIGQRREFLRQHGSVQFDQLEEEQNAENRNRLCRKSTDPQSFRMIEQNEATIIVEVDPGENAIPHETTRFQLTIENGNWVIDDFFWKCQCEDGDCNWCDGSGVCAVCGGKGDCKFCDGQLTCQLCKGVKRCSICISSKMPGWNSMRPQSKLARN